jgi:hypothetical protein
MNNELKGMWKDAVVAYFKVLFQHSVRETGTPTKDRFHCSHYLSRASNKTPLEYKLPPEALCFSKFVLVL